MSSANKATTSTLPSLTELDELIRGGNIVDAKNRLRNINRAKLARTELAAYAAMANRVYEPRLAYRLLHTVVREERASLPATANERLEYAEALRGMGLIQESLGLLQDIDSTAYPITHLRRSFCYMTQWRYEEAIPSLKKYIASVERTNYSSTIARVNLAAALVINRSDQEAHALLSELRTETKSAGHELLFGNCLELTSQLLVLQGRYDEAEQIFDEVSTTFNKTTTRYSLYLRKWRAISKSMQAGKVSVDLLSCRESACQDQDWETLRECDLYIGFLTKDQKLIDQVYFGTPFESYRRRVLALVGKELAPSEEFVGNPNGILKSLIPRTLNEPFGTTDTSNHIIFDLANACFESHKIDRQQTAALESGQLMHRMMVLLVSDFYRPLSVASAFSELFPEEHFLQTGSTNRIFQVIKRLRIWFETHGNYFSIEEQDGNYRLIAAEGVQIRIRKTGRRCRPTR